MAEMQGYKLLPLSKRMTVERELASDNFAFILENGVRLELIDEEKKDFQACFDKVFMRHFPLKKVEIKEGSCDEPIK